MLLDGEKHCENGVLWSQDVEFNALTLTPPPLPYVLLSYAENLR